MQVTTVSIKLLQKTPIARSNISLSSLIPENNTVLKQVKEVGYKKKMRHTKILHVLSPTHELTELLWQ